MDVVTTGTIGWIATTVPARNWAPARPRTGMIATYGRRPEADQRGEPAWSLSRDDWRLLWVTFAGGVASFVVGAAILGLAFGIVRAFRSKGGPADWLTALITAPTLVVITVLFYLAFFRARRPGRIITPRVNAVLTLMSLVVGVWLLLLAGLAAGIK